MSTQATRQTNESMDEIICAVTPEPLAGPEGK
jgi:hypothetical protein